MRPSPYLIAAVAAGALTACSEPAQPQSPAPASPAQTTESPTPMTQDALAFTSIAGEDMALTDLGGKAYLVVNTASKCGYTPQYTGLQELYETFQASGLVVVGVPSNDFGGQEPGTEEEVKSFCEINYGVTFPLTQKYPVTGAGQHPFYAAAVDAIGEQAQPKWNFHKVLVAGDGTVLKAYPSAVKPADAELVADIEAALAG